MACITTYSGIHMNPINPKINDICLVDIAHSLSLLCRANGHFKHFYSIAQHSINCANEAKSRNLSKETQLACLLHDASEAYISDITRPLKVNLPEYLIIEEQLQKIIYEKFEIKNVDYTIVEEIDNAVLYTEFLKIMNEKIYDTPLEIVSNIDCSEKDYKAVKNMFLRLGENLINEKPVISALGIDGCRFGWCVVKLDSLGNCSLKLIEKIEEIMHIKADTAIAIIDIPIGMVDGGNKERACDLQARKLLKKRSSSVFPVPCRKAVSANSYEEACKINNDLTERKISAMSWAIVPKIREVDEFLRANRQMSNYLLESHPELCFAKLIDKPCSHPKKDQQGELERIGALKEHLDISYLLHNHTYSAKQVKRGDIIDAAVLALTGLKVIENGTVTENAQTDSMGLKMQMVVANYSTSTQVV